MCSRRNTAIQLKIVYKLQVTRVIAMIKAFAFIYLGAGV